MHFKTDDYREALNSRAKLVFILMMIVFARRTRQKIITKTCPFKYTENLPPKNENVQTNNSDIFHSSAQNIDCRYSLEPPRRGGSNE